MTFNDIGEIKKAGFTGFVSMKQLFLDSSVLPAIKGVYMVLNLDMNLHDFLPVGSGGYFKGKNPNVSISELKANWVENTIVVYIGKAGKDGSAAAICGIQYKGYTKHLLRAHVCKTCAACGIHFNLHKLSTIAPVDAGECPGYRRSLPDVGRKKAKGIGSSIMCFLVNNCSNC